MHIFGIGNIQLQTLMTFILNYVEAVGVFSDVAVKKVVVHMQEVMQKLSVGFVTIAFPGLALFQALVSIASIAHKTVDSQGVGSAHIYGLVMDENTFPDNPFQRFLGCVPIETYSWKNRIPTCQIGVHGYWHFQSLDQNISWYYFDNDGIGDDILYNTKGDGSRFD